MKWNDEMATGDAGACGRRVGSGHTFSMLVQCQREGGRSFNVEAGPFVSSKMKKIVRNELFVSESELEVEWRWKVLVGWAQGTVSRQKTRNHWA